MYAYGAGTGVGKTDSLKQVMGHLIKVHKQKVATLLFEEPDLMQTIDSVAGKIDGAIYHVPDIEVDPVKKEATKQSLRDSLYLYDVKGSDINRDRLLSVIRYFVLAHGCTQIFLDHVTFMLDAEEDERALEAQKKLMRGLNDLNKELPFTLHYVSHLRKANNGRKPHEEGGRVYLDDFLGGKASTQYANFVFAFERDQQGDQKNFSILRVLKDRFTGRATGRTFQLEYNETTGVKTEVEDLPFEQETSDNFDNEEF
jgi:twinkle protein